MEDFQLYNEGHVISTQESVYFIILSINFNAKDSEKQKLTFLLLEKNADVFFKGDINFSIVMRLIIVFL